MLRRDLRVAFANGQLRSVLNETLRALGEFLQVHVVFPLSPCRSAWCQLEATVSPYSNRVAAPQHKRVRVNRLLVD